MKGIKRILLLTTLLISAFVFTKELDAASGYIQVYSSRNSLVVGGTFTVDVTISSSAPLGSWEYTISYDSSKLRLTSGQASVVDYGDGSIKSKTYSYTFKAIASGASTVTVKSYNAYAWDESKMSLSCGSERISAITQAELEASYSKNNNLKNITVSAGSLSPAFSSSVLNYTVNVGSNVEKITINAEKEDRYATVTGGGEHSLSEGDNKFDIKVTAENGSVKTYTVTVKVEDKNPVTKELDGKTYTVIKRASSIKVPETYSLTVIKINDIEVPSLYSEVTNMTLLAMKDSEGKDYLFVYDKSSDTISNYNEVKSDSARFYITKCDKVLEGYKETMTTIGEYTVPVYTSSKYNSTLVCALNIETNTSDIYFYDKDNNFFSKYNDSYDKVINDLNKTNKNFLYIIIGVGGEALLMTIILIVVLIKKNKLKKKVIAIESAISEKKDKRKKKEEVVEEN